MRGDNLKKYNSLSWRRSDVRPIPSATPFPLRAPVALSPTFPRDFRALWHVPADRDGSLRVRGTVFGGVSLCATGRGGVSLFHGI